MLGAFINNLRRLSILVARPVRHLCRFISVVVALVHGADMLDTICTSRRDGCSVAIIGIDACEHFAVGRLDLQTNKSEYKGTTAKGDKGAYILEDHRPSLPLPLQFSQDPYNLPKFRTKKPLMVTLHAVRQRAT